MYHIVKYEKNYILLVCFAGIEKGDKRIVLFSVYVVKNDATFLYRKWWCLKNYISTNNCSFPSEQSSIVKWITNAKIQSMKLFTKKAGFISLFFTNLTKR